MARWRLAAPHYLKVPGTVWRYAETDRTTGEEHMQVFDVPRLLDPSDPKHQNKQGEIVVCDGNNPQPGDRIFEGSPTPDMVPLDAEAEAISAEWAPKWKHPIDTLPSNGDYGSALLERLEKQLTEVMRQGGAVSPQTAGVPVEDFRALQEQVAALMAQNAELTTKAEPKAAGRRT